MSCYINIFYESVLGTRARRYTWGKEHVGNGACEVRENVAHETRLAYKHVGHVIQKIN